MESSRKRADPPSRLRVSTQSGLPSVSAPSGGVVLGRTAALAWRARRALVPLACVAFVAFAALALVFLKSGAPADTGVTVDARGVVSTVAPNSEAWGAGVRPGWLVTADGGNVATYTSPAGSIRILSNEQPASGPMSVTALAPAFAAILLAGVLAAARQRRTGLTLAVAAAVMSSTALATDFGVAGQGVAVVPAGLAAAMAWQVSSGVGMRPRFMRPIALMLIAIAAFVLGALSVGLVAGVAAASIVFMAVAWIGVVRWRVAAVAAAGANSRPAVVRAVIIEMLPFSDRVRRRGAQAERDRLASDLHAEVLPAIASTAAQLERRGASREAEELRNLAASVRDLVSDRRLPILDDDGLVAAAEWLAESLQVRADLTIEIDLRGNDGSRQPKAVEKAAYRILQLALDNVIRHAGATCARVGIAGGAHLLTLTIADDGKGIDPGKVVRAMSVGRLGLADMRTEADRIGASLEIGPGSPGGTLVKVRWRG